MPEEKKRERENGGEKESVSAREVSSRGSRRRRGSHLHLQHHHHTPNLVAKNRRKFEESRTVAPVPLPIAPPKFGSDPRNTSGDGGCALGPISTPDPRVWLRFVVLQPTLSHALSSILHCPSPSPLPWRFGLSLLPRPPSPHCLTSATATDGAVAAVDAFIRILSPVAVVFLPPSSARAALLPYDASALSRAHPPSHSSGSHTTRSGFFTGCSSPP